MEFMEGRQLLNHIAVKLCYGLPIYLVVAQCVFSESAYEIDKVVASRKV